MAEEHVQATISQRGVVFAADDVLVVRRADDGVWELPGGRLDHGEGAREGLERELVEETTLEPTVVEPVHTFVWQNDTGQERFAVCYYCRTSRRGVSLSKEHDDFTWVSPAMAQTYLDAQQVIAVSHAVDAHQTMRV